MHWYISCFWKNVLSTYFIAAKNKWKQACPSRLCSTHCPHVPWPHCLSHRFVCIPRLSKLNISREVLCQQLLSWSHSLGTPVPPKNYVFLKGRVEGGHSWSKKNHFKFGADPTGTLVMNVWENLQYIFPKKGSKAVWSFSKNSSTLGGTGVRYLVCFLNPNF